MAGGGVTAVIDYVLAFSARLKDDERRAVSSSSSNMPATPFRNGTPQETGLKRVADLTGRAPCMDGQVYEAVAATAKRLGTAA